MAYNKEGGNSPARRRGPRREKKYVHSVQIKSITSSITKMLQN